jgi:hypothetical protein
MVECGTGIMLKSHLTAWILAIHAYRRLLSDALFWR